MLLRLYYILKPFIPRSIQIAVRRRVMLRRWKKCRDVWPIHEGTDNPPISWPSWPGGKRFAVVLTHDVEGTRGVEKCLYLANLEKSYGFRSSFNFVCEDYPIPEDLLAHLKREGFEIGIHGLNHRGNPFRSRRVFQKQAPRINSYIHKLGCEGFRTPCMYHNLDWLTELDIKYDASTFDVDPFEPQPDGVHTIFPFIVSSSSGGNGRSYVEMPYTLPQDSTLFIFLKQDNIDLWKKKLDWIAEKGGMALVITHPDYAAIGKGSIRVDEYPIGHYEDLLRYLRVYEGQYWHALPRDVARYCIKSLHPKGNKTVEAS